MKQETQQFKWVKPKEATPEIYTNFVHASWSLFDVRVTLGQLVPEEPGQAHGFVVEERAAVSFAWPQAKALRDMLISLVETYEKTNGEIKPLKLAPAPEFPSSVVASEE